MATTPEEFARVDQACVIAAAGCGKTRLIADTARLLKTRQLILTHTHAGVHALRRKLQNAAVPPAQYELMTIDGFALRWAASYPKTSGISARSPRDAEWSEIHPSALNVLQRQLTIDHLRRSFDGVFVDEYQDCSPHQHSLISGVADALPVRIVGDPMQGIFDFGDGLVDFDEDVFPRFERLEDLDQPHRWASTNPELGLWLQVVRDKVEQGQPVDYSTGPVEMWDSDPATLVAGAKRLAGADGSVVVIRAQAAQAHAFAKGTSGRYQSMEEMECKSLMDVAASLDSAQGPERSAVLYQLVQAAVSGLTDSGTLGGRIGTYRTGGLPSVPSGKYSVAISSLNEFAESGSADSGRAAMRSLVRVTGKKPFRRELLQELDRAFAYRASHPEVSMSEAAWNVRDITRRRGRRPWRLSVGRTFLIKGLEYEHVLALDLQQLDPYPLYVALTRSSTTLCVAVEDG